MQLDIAYLQSCYRKGSLTPTQLIAELRAACQKADPTIWIHLLTEEELTPYLERLARSTMEELPLYGIPFAIKDNIDLAGIPTTAACPEYSYLPQQSATVVQLLVDAGAIPLGKTNLDQFATGLVGTRSPYGGCTNSFDPDYISGGSSSGSAVAVAKGLCSFALGTDTAGSGRVPAAFNNLIGLKPSKGLISTQGVVPACRSLDCVSIFALCTGDAETVLQVTAQPDAGDPYSRQITHRSRKYSGKESCIFGVPQEDQLQFFGNATYEKAFHEAVARLEAIGGSKRVIDLQPFLDAAKLLYEGPWVAERTAAVGGFLADHPEAGYPVTRRIICESNTFSAVDCFQAQYRLQAFKATTDRILSQLDCLVLPTAGTCYTLKEVEENPITLNSNLGTYTNFMNLLDYCGIAVPTALTASVPFGVTLVGEAFSEERLLALAARLHEASNLPMGTGQSLPPKYSPVEVSDRTLLMVCGAHLQGLPLHYQLEELDAYLVEQTTTAPRYRMFALETQPPKPGLVRDAAQGAALEVEVYSIPLNNLGPFITQIPHPLGIGKVELKNGSWATGFIAEPVVMKEGKEVTGLGGWRRYLATRAE